MPKGVRVGANVQAGYFISLENALQEAAYRAKRAEATTEKVSERQLNATLALAWAQIAAVIDSSGERPTR